MDCSPHKIVNIGVTLYFICINFDEEYRCEDNCGVPSVFINAYLDSPYGSRAQISICRALSGEKCIIGPVCYMSYMTKEVNSSIVRQFCIASYIYLRASVQLQALDLVANGDYLLKLYVEIIESVARHILYYCFMLC